GRRAIPAGYDLRLPAERSSGFEERYAELGAEQRVMRVANPSVTARRSPARTVGSAHRVGRGGTLSHLAQRYRVNVASLRTANRIKGKQIRPGQVLKIPRRT